ncbi:ABC transporter permease [Litoreibacter arenae]|uniref:Spermidine Putrescine ABC transporter permease component potC n=1 Tax=Litoreibacter arenae DSM 19593 TaxID=1123360 RepID=S9QIJ4_9RHOB|nr:ABC transporter permease [Litoreibacter arenae]EPX79408.1 Spermidine Putrescine ABC transporter permease component potC [Litoreibacter arenae DSM 19593]
MNTSRTASWVIIGLTLLFLIGPFVVIVLAALTNGNNLAFPPEGLSLRWFIKVFTIESFRDSFVISMVLAVFGTLAALVIGVPAAYAIVRYKVPGAGAVQLIVSSPLIVPGIIVGLALLRYLVIPTGFTIFATLFLAHTALILPYAVRVVTSSMQNLRTDVEEAALILGCSRLGSFFRVVFPNIRGGILAAFILGFVTSFNQVPVSLFLSGPGVRTLPIDMLAYMETTYDPSVAALACLLAVMSVGIVFAAEKFLGFSKYV